MTNRSIFGWTRLNEWHPTYPTCRASGLIDFRVADSLTELIGGGQKAVKTLLFDLQMERANLGRDPYIYSDRKVSFDRWRDHAVK